MAVMIFSAPQDRDAAIAALLGVARRETLLLAIASDALDDEAAAVASARLRWAIGAARQLIAGCGREPGAPRRAEQLDRIANRAQRLLVDEPPRSPQAIADLVNRVAARHGARAPAITADHAHLVDLDLDDLELARVSLRGANLTEVTARRAGCDGVDARASRWLRCSLERGSLAMAVFSGSTLERCDLSHANLDGTSWHRASVAHTRLVRAALTDARLDGAVFTDCDLRGAELGITGSPHAASLAGARFVRCDLRETRWAGRDLGGAALVDCKLFGAHGAPALAGVVIERADLSLLGDGTRIATQREAVVGWRTLLGAARSTVITSAG
jgi:uncharacterized protein YjbI with pentapeptide repeats